MVLTSRVRRRAMARIGMCSSRSRCSSCCSSGVSMVGGLLVEVVGQLDDLRDEPSLAGLEHALFGVGEPGELELRELFERLLGLEEAGLELARVVAERCPSSRWPASSGASRWPRVKPPSPHPRPGPTSLAAWGCER